MDNIFIEKPGKVEHLHIKMTVEQKEVLSNLAWLQHTDMSKYIISLIKEDYEKVTKTDTYRKNFPE